MPSPKTILNLPPCTSTEVSRAQALMHVLNSLRQDIGAEAALMVAADMTNYDGPEPFVSVIVPTGKVIRAYDRYHITTN